MASSQPPSESPADNASLLLVAGERECQRVEEALQRAGVKVVTERATTAAAAEAALSRTWGLVLCGSEVPDMGFAEVQALWSKHGKELPFVVLSRDWSEATLEASMRAGALDYITEDRFSHLVPVVQR